MLSCPAYADIASTSYIKNAIQSKWGINLAAGEGIASSSYLFVTIDAANLALNGQSTTYGQNITGSNVIAKSKVDIELEKIKYCVPGTYMPPDSNDCSDCGLGHYCTGGIHRAPCTGGVIACNGTNHDADTMAPENLLNRELSLAEVNANIPPTDLSQWERISMCSTFSGGSTNTPNYQNVVTGCATGTIGPGTYMFIVRHTSNGLGPDSFTGEANAASNTRIIVFDHPVSYKSIHISNSLWNWVDLDHTTFTTSSYHVPLANYASNSVYSNVSGFPGNTATGAVLHVYELK